MHSSKSQDPCIGPKDAKDASICSAAAPLRKAHGKRLELALGVTRAPASGEGRARLTSMKGELRMARMARQQVHWIFVPIQPVRLHWVLGSEKKGADWRPSPRMPLGMEGLEKRRRRAVSDRSPRGPEACSCTFSASSTTVFTKSCSSSCASCSSGGNGGQAEADTGDIRMAGKHDHSGWS